MQLSHARRFRGRIVHVGGASVVATPHKPGGWFHDLFGGPSLPAHPDSVDYQTRAPGALATMLGNDSEGDCVEAADLLGRQIDQRRLGGFVVLAFLYTDDRTQ